MILPHEAGAYPLAFMSQTSPGFIGLENNIRELSAEAVEAFWILLVFNLKTQHIAQDFDHVFIVLLVKPFCFSERGPIQLDQNHRISIALR